MAETKSTEYLDRLKKLEELKAKGKTPYAFGFQRTHTSKEALKLGEEKEPRTVEEILAKSSDNLIKLSGRLKSFRKHGKLSFAHLMDFFGTIQICFMNDKMGSEKYDEISLLDVADFVGVTGELFRTKHGEITLLVYEYEVLSKALRPLPEKWHGLSDQEQIYRQRYLDTVMERESLDRFIFRSDFVRALREFYWSEGFYEIESPYLENTSSGATAKPFITHHNALDMDVFLRIAGGETWHKMAIVSGFEKVFEIGRCFRNEGMDPSHLQEFSMVEHYGAFWSFEDNMKFTERMFEYFMMKIFGKMTAMVKDREGNDVEVDFTTPWPRKEFTKLILEDSGIDVLKTEDAEVLLKEIKAKGIMIEDADKMGYGNLVDALYKKVSRPKLIQPCFVIKHPYHTKPLARRNDSDPRLCDTFQLLVNTWEVVNAYGELVDPIDQRERFEKQALAKAGGDEEAMSMNEEYLTCMEHGMPCMSGFGMGIDRIVTLLTRQENLKDTVLFPLMKPKGN
ncbi:MAG: lysine--tRNA ligase [Candidatus Gracilibacteria bacterium]|jgi:lysyl-tRNA synthetase class 2|nr:lysine--tRNA ligase [Candidatus Gracilibacteria bacterium]